jgi:hypothetical protein
MISACGAPAPKPAPDPKPVAAPNLNLNDDQSVAERSSVQRERHSRTTIYRGPNAATKPSDQLYIRASKTDAGDVSYQIYVVIGYSGAWRFYNWAYDTNGNSLYLTVMTRNLAACNRDDCSHNEHLVIDVTRKYLEENMQSGLRIRVSGKKEDAKEEFLIPAGYIKAFLTLSGESR